ncbi:hypothetical protein CGRA01v4_11477 [Colletotrichum graminicola]|nr:hypothetical protein CGRA01v4_11477 [Colletotrichum graminicola]
MASTSERVNGRFLGILQCPVRDRPCSRYQRSQLPDKNAVIEHGSRTFSPCPAGFPSTHGMWYRSKVNPVGTESPDKRSLTLRETSVPVPRSAIEKPHMPDISFQRASVKPESSSLGR